MKDRNIYSYTLRFDKDATLDHQALDKITQFCEITHMSKHAAMMFILATADITVLHESILSLTATAKVQDIEEDSKRKNNKKSKNVPVYEEQQEEEKNLEEKEDDDLLLNPLFRKIFSDS